MKNLKVFGLHFDDSAVSDYRIWTPFKALNKLKLCECRRLPDNPGRIPFPMTRDSSEYDIQYGSFQDMGEWADLFVAQRIDDLASLSKVMGVRDQFGIPVIAELDDNVLWLPPSNQAFAQLRIKSVGEGVVAIPIKPEDVLSFRQRNDGIVRGTEEQGYQFFTFKEQPKGREIAISFLKESDAITCTTDYLADEFRKLNPYVYVLPNSLDMDRWNLEVEKHPDGEVRLAWFGGTQHYEDLRVVEKVLPMILEKYPHVTFHTTAYRPDFFKDFYDHPRVQMHPYAPVQEWPSYLAARGIDIAIVPLSDNRFNRSKSNIKFLEYGILGIPAVFSNIEPYKDVMDGETGMLASTEDEWMFCLSRMIEDESFRKGIGIRAKVYVKEHYDQKATARLWKKCYEEVYHRTYRMRKRQSERAKKDLLKYGVKEAARMKLT